MQSCRARRHVTERASTLCRFRDKQRIKQYTPTLLLRREGFMFPLHFTGNLINTFFDRSADEVPAEVWNFYWVLWITAGRVLVLEVYLAPLNHTWAPRFWRLSLTSTLVKHDYKPPPSFLGVVDTVPNLCHWARVLSSCNKGMAGGARLAPISHATKPGPLIWTRTTALASNWAVLMIKQKHKFSSTASPF